MDSEASGDRRTDIINQLNIRLSVLESNHTEQVRARMHNDDAIADLLKSNLATVLALNTISSKFDTLISQFTLGFKILSAGAVIIASIMGAFWTYSNALDMKYQKKSEAAVSGMQSAKKQLKEQETSIDNLSSDADKRSERIDNIDEEVEIIKKKRAVKASR